MSVRTIVSTIVIRTLPGQGPEVERRLGMDPRIASLQLDGGHRLHGTWRQPETEPADSVLNVVARLHPAIIAVHAVRRDA